MGSARPCCPPCPLPPASQADPGAPECPLPQVALARLTCEPLAEGGSGLAGCPQPPPHPQPSALCPELRSAWGRAVLLGTGAAGRPAEDPFCPQQSSAGQKASPRPGGSCYAPHHPHTQLPSHGLTWWLPLPASLLLTLEGASLRLLSHFCFHDLGQVSPRTTPACGGRLSSQPERSMALTRGFSRDSLQTSSVSVLASCGAGPSWRCRMPEPEAFLGWLTPTGEESSVEGWACLPRTSHPNPLRLCPHCPASQHPSPSHSVPQPRTQPGSGRRHGGECAPSRCSRQQGPGLRPSGAAEDPGRGRSWLSALLTPWDLRNRSPRIWCLRA